MNVYLGELYKEVEYIETSGTQYIETPFKTQDGYLHKTKVRYLSFNTNWCSFGGGYSIGPEARFFLGARSDRNQWTWGLGNYSGDLGSVSTGVDYELEAKLYNGSQSFIVNGSTLKTDTFSFSASERYNVCLIGSSYYDATLAWSSTRVYYYKLYDSSNNLVLDMIPCYRVSDNEIGMFDKVNNQFYTNSGTGVFTKGADVKTFQAELQNAYIGEYKGFVPGANTIAYYPLTSTSTVNDMSGNNKTLTNFNNVQFGTYNGVDCCYCDGTNRLGNTSISTAYIGQTSTMSVWMTYIPNYSMRVGNANNYPNYQKHIGLNFLLSNGSVRYGGGGNNNTWNDITYNTSTTANIWYNIVQTISQDGTRKGYLNGVLVASGTLTVGLDDAWFTIGAAQYSSSEIYYMGGNASEFILENKARTAQEISAYYNTTKSNYGL